jgi:hypothetical protein
VYQKGEICFGSGQTACSNFAESSFAHNSQTESAATRIQSNDNPQNFLMQPDDSAWRTAVQQQCAGYVSNGWDGCFFDMQGPDSYGLSGGPPWNHSKNQQYSGDDWANLASSEYSWLQTNLSGHHLTANGLDKPTCVPSPGCVVAGSNYYTSGLLVDNATTDYGAVMENFAPAAGLATLADWLGITLSVLLPQNPHVQVISKSAVADHQSSLALFLAGDNAPANLYWSYCVGPNSACESPDSWYVKAYDNMLVNGGYQDLGNNGSVTHVTWTTGNCFINTNNTQSTITIPGRTGHTEYGLDGSVHTAGDTYTLNADTGPSSTNTGQCFMPTDN